MFAARCANADPDMHDSTEAAWSAIAAAAAERYRKLGGHAYRFARSKLRRDGVFRALLAGGLVRPGARVLDLGCGQGLLAALLSAAAQAAERQCGPAGWPPAPIGARLTGVDRLADDLERARAALGDAAEFIQGDMRYPPDGTYDLIVFLDTLHYLEPPDQLALLARTRTMLGAAGAMLLRVHDDAAPLRAAFGRWIDRCTSALYGGGFAPVHGRPVADWCAQLAVLGLRTVTCRVDGRAPFANRLIVARAMGPNALGADALGSDSLDEDATPPHALRRSAQSEEFPR